VLDPGASASRPASRPSTGDEEDSFTAAAGFAAARALADVGLRAPHPVEGDAGSGVSPFVRALGSKSSRVVPEPVPATPASTSMASQLRALTAGLNADGKGKTQ
jgi:hypothetical protein